MPSSLRTRSAAFTLVELLIAILIISVLVVLGVAKFAPATAAAKTRKAQKALTSAVADAQAYYAVGRTLDELAPADLEDVQITTIIDRSSEAATDSEAECTVTNLNSSVVAAIGTLQYCAHGDTFAAITGAPNGSVGSAGVGGVTPLGAIRGQAAGELDVWGITMTEDQIMGPVKLDPTPTVEITDMPDDPTFEDGASFTFVTGGGAYTTLECKLDTGDYGACDSSTTMAYTGLAFGEHSFRVRVSNGGGSSSDSFSWTIEQLPTVEITDQPANPTTDPNASFTFATGGGAYTALECKLDDDDYGSCDSSTTMAYTDLALGEHTFSVRVSKSGSSSSDSFSWTIDPLVPAGSHLVQVGGKLRYSSDGLATMNDITDTAAGSGQTVRRFATPAENVIWVASNASAKSIRLSVNGGASFQDRDLPANCFSNSDGTALTEMFLPVSATVAYVKTSTAGCRYVTTDGGTNWSTIGQPSGGTLLELGADPSAPNVVWGFGFKSTDSNQYHVWKSTDYAASWTDVYDSESSAGHGDRHISSYGTQSMCVQFTQIISGSQRHRFYCTADSGANWTANTYAGTVYESMTFIIRVDSSGALWFVNADNVLRSTDGGATWTYKLLGAGFSLRAIRQLGSEYWAIRTTTPNSKAYRSTDGGSTWTTKTPSSLGAADDTALIQNVQIMPG